MNIASEFRVCISIVSHGQGNLIQKLLMDLLKLRNQIFEILITLNIPEDDSFLNNFNKLLPIYVIRNSKPKGFGSNHNSAFGITNSNYFIIMNPDIRFSDINLEQLLVLAKKKSTGLVAPIVYDKTGRVQDSARRFPTFSRLVLRKICSNQGADYTCGSEPICVDWVAGMFMVFRSEVYSHIGGFNEDYFMYFEDVDICRRLHLLGLNIILNPDVGVIHEAQRASKREFKYFLWHLSSAIRYLIKLRLNL